MRVWESVKPTSISYRSIFRWAQEAGWHNPGHARPADLSAFPMLGGAEERAASAVALTFVDFTALARGDPPPRRWIVDGWFPRKTVIALFGRGGHGKSLLVEQLGFAVANGIKFLGLDVTRGPVLGIFCEDDGDELLRRGRAISSALFLQPGEGVADLHLDARAGKDNLLVAFGADNRPQPQPLMAALRAECERVRPVLVIIDNIAQVFAGQENVRAQVTSFCNLLTGLARDFDCAVLLLGHLAKAEGSEYSGSTAWDAAVRSRLLLERLDDGTALLRKLKANYAATDEIRLEFRNGVFVRLTGNGGDAAALAGLKSHITAAIQTYAAREQAVSHVTTARNNLVRMLVDDNLIAEGSRRSARLALTALIDDGVVLVNQELPWKSASRHPVRGLALADRPALDDAPPQGDLANFGKVNGVEGTS